MHSHVYAENDDNDLSRLGILLSNFGISAFVACSHITYFVALLPI